MTEFRRELSKLLVLIMLGTLEFHFLAAGYLVAAIVVWVMILAVTIFIFIDYFYNTNRWEDIKSQCGVNSSDCFYDEGFEEDEYQESEIDALRRARLERQTNLQIAQSKKPMMGVGEGLLIGVMLGFGFGG